MGDNEGIAAIQALARQRLDPATAETVGDFIPAYYGHLAGSDLAERLPRDLLGAALAHLRLGSIRAPGEALVAVTNPDLAADGWQSLHSIVQVVTDDMPFLVDSVRMAVLASGLGIHLVVHPLFDVERLNGQIVRCAESDDPNEAWIALEVDRAAAPRRDELSMRLRAALDDVRLAVADYPAMRDRVAELAYEMDHSVGGLGTDEPRRSAEFLRWLVDDHFMFLGYREYDYVDGVDGQSRSVTVEAVAGTGLGLLRDGRREHGDRRPDALSATAAAKIRERNLMYVTVANSRSTVHRPEYLDYVAVKRFAEDGTITGERRILGLFPEWIGRISVFTIPLVRDKVSEVFDRSGYPVDSHGGRGLRFVLESFPRDELFQIGTDDLERIAIGILDLQDRRQVRVLSRRDDFGRFVSCFVFMPRDRFSTSTAEAMAAALMEVYSGVSREHAVAVGGAALARLHVRIQLGPGSPPDVDTVDLERRLSAIARDWSDGLRSALVERLGEDAGLMAFARYGSAFPLTYRDSYDPDIAVEDIGRMDQLTEGADLVAVMERSLGSPPDRFRFVVLRAGSTLDLSDEVPLLEHLGLRVIDEQPHEIRLANDTVVWRHDIAVAVPSGSCIEDPAVRSEVSATFAAVLRGDVESDGFNRLVLVAGLSAIQVAVLRAYAKYLRQAGLPFSQAYVEGTLTKHGAIAVLLVELFEARLRPGNDENRSTRAAMITGQLGAALDAVPSLDDDRILRSLWTLVEATLRTNFYQGRPVLSFKLDPRQIPDLPQPRPMFEIWVYSPRVEGVHLRGGMVARGGIRWSDRREDFRTEVLGLMKAQVVKNAVIVPTGAKGGFVVKRRDDMPDAVALRAEVEACYRLFIAGLLDVTDNVVGHVVVGPPDVVRHDGDDPYFVVAADKGTATFSDIANEVAAGYRFWLGDAFASGGSVGYDHKQMAITARGAWESVRRHARTLGLDADTSELTVVGIGDMSGDVFGNGLLRSPHVKLVGAFDHRHVFVDPDPDPATSFAERRRLFDRPRSSWDDYDRALISPGGGVFPRSAKSVEVSPEVATRLAIAQGPITPNDLIVAILKAGADLLWNGGIGTFVKASTEGHSDAGDRTSDAIRVDANQLRVRMVGEGGNLGFTQRARVEYALAGGLIFTDAIDNSAGVDCSDHEVNIKILLDAQVTAGELTLKQRNELLVTMTDDVGELVLDDNRAQTLALTIARRQAAPMVDVHARYLKVLEHEGWINRQLEFLPNEKQMTERAAQGIGLTTPEFAVLLAYTKTTNTHLLLESDLPDDLYVQRELIAYFPPALRQRYRVAMAGHRLRREIVATAIANQMVNRAGISFDHRMTEETGAGVADITRAYIVAADVCELARWWDEIAQIDSSVPPEVQIGLLLDLRRWVERCVLWLLRHRRSPIALAATYEAFAPGVAELAMELAPVLKGTFRATVRTVTKTRVGAGVAPALAERSAVWPLLHTGLDVIEIASGHGLRPTDVARVYWQLFHELDVAWLWDRVGALPRTDRWQTSARSAQRDDLLGCLRELTDAVVGRDPSATATTAVEEWADRNERQIARLKDVFTEIKTGAVYDLTTVSVALRQLRNTA